MLVTMNDVRASPLFFKKNTFDERADIKVICHFTRDKGNKEGEYKERCCNINELQPDKGYFLCNIEHLEKSCPQGIANRHKRHKNHGEAYNSPCDPVAGRKVEFLDREAIEGREYMRHEVFDTIDNLMRKTCVAA